MHSLKTSATEQRNKNESGNKSLTFSFSTLLNRKIVNTQLFAKFMKITLKFPWKNVLNVEHKNSWFSERTENRTFKIIGLFTCLNNSTWVNIFFSKLSFYPFYLGICITSLLYHNVCKSLKLSHFQFYVKNYFIAVLFLCQN